MKKRTIIHVTVGLVTSCLASSAASFTFTGGNARLGANWQNDGDLTSGTVPGVGDTGLINISGNVTGNTAGAWNGAVITQTAGILTGTWNINSPTATYNLEGGTIDNAGNFNANGSTFNLSGGLLQFTGELIVNTATGVINVSGSTTIESDSGNFDLRLNNDDAEFNIAADWTGSFISNSDVTEADWITQLVTGAGQADADGPVDTDRLINVGGTDITASNFGDFFVVTANSGGGSTLTLVPEPSSAALLGLGGLALIMRRRK